MNRWEVGKEDEILRRLPRLKVPGEKGRMESKRYSEDCKTKAVQVLLQSFD